MRREVHLIGSDYYLDTETSGLHYEHNRYLNLVFFGVIYYQAFAKSAEQRGGDGDSKVNQVTKT